MVKHKGHKAKRAPFTDEEKEYIFEMMTEAKSKGLALDTVASDLADSLESSHFTVRNVYNKMRVAKRNEPEKETKSIEQLTLVEEVDAEEIITESGEVNVVTTEQPTRVNTPSIPEVVEEFKKEIIAEYLKENKPTPEVDYSPINVLLDRIEKLIQERDAWKNKFELSETENKKLKDKFLKQLLSD